jgi:hypothetical protein
MHQISHFLGESRENRSKWILLPDAVTFAGDSFVVSSRSTRINNARLVLPFASCFSYYPRPLIWYIGLLQIAHHLEHYPSPGPSVG